MIRSDYSIYQETGDRRWEMAYGRKDLQCHYMKRVSVLENLKRREEK